MAVLFKNDFLDGFGTWALGYIPYGGAPTAVWVDRGDRLR